MAEDGRYEYIYFPTITVGGSNPGQYIARCPIPSDAQYAEFCVVSVNNAGTASANVTISGVDFPVDPQMTANAANIFSDQSAIRGTLYRLGVNGLATPGEFWERIANPLGVVFVTIGNGAIGSPVQTYASIKFRVRTLLRIPDVFKTVDPEHMEEANHQRARRVEAMVLGREGEIETYSQRPDVPGTTRQIETASSLVKGQGMFKRK